MTQKHFFQQILDRHLPGVQLNHIESVSGGDISRAFRLQTQNQTYFCKLNSSFSEVFFQSERDNLSHLALALKPIKRTPDIIDCGQINNQSYLLMEFLETSPITPSDYVELASNLARIHHFYHHSYGWHHDNFIGSSYQKGGFLQTDWMNFFIEFRILPQSVNAFNHGLLSKSEAASIEMICSKLGSQWKELHSVPSLCHGDLWYGNIIKVKETGFFFIDPACSYSNRETDIAMTELFGSFPEAFYQTYNEVFPLTDGYSERKPFWNLYHNLNHLNLFGSSYLESVRKIIQYYTHQ